MKLVFAAFLLAAILVFGADCCDHDRECEIGQCCKGYVGGIIKTCQDLKLEDERCKGTFYCDCARNLECVPHDSRLSIGVGTCQRSTQVKGTFNP